MANCSQTNNTKIGTSAVTYDSTPLPCTDVKACDDLNTILTKFDNVICSAINSVNILTEEVMNITEDLMIITEEIEDINNQIFICCPICDFTATATELPVCDFTGSANQLPDPTTTTTSSSSTSTSTSTSTTTSSSSTSTSTSTTTTCPCYTWDIDATPEDVDAGINLNYISCNGDPTNEEIIGSRPFTRCIQSGSTPGLTRDDSAPLQGSTLVQTSDCCTSPPPASTTTTTTLPSGNLIVENESSNLTVNTITSAAGTIIIPVVPPGNTITGSHSDIPTPINVNVTMSSAFTNCMSLYVNNVYIQQINLTGTGTYSFNTTSILVTDIVRILIVNLACIEPE
jgi:hypothetical protein